MSLNKYLLYGLAAVACLVQVGCNSGGPPIDLRNPTVAELDAADVRWGLQPRKGKGAPKRAYQYQMDEQPSGGTPSAPVPVASAPAPATPPSAPSNPIPPAPDPQIDVNKLR